MSDDMGRELAYLSSHATNRYFIPNWGKSFYKQHALIQWSSVEGKVFYKQHALKGQKLLAQGNALGYHERKPVAL